MAASASQAAAGSGLLSQIYLVWPPVIIMTPARGGINNQIMAPGPILPAACAQPKTMSKSLFLTILVARQ